MNYITFDIETYSPTNSKQINTSEFRVTVIGAYFSWIDEFVAFVEDQVEEFINLLQEAQLVIGYNHTWFDLPVLQKYANYNLLNLPTYDLMVEIEKKLGFKVKLDDMCKSNFNEDKKTDSYKNFYNYHQQGKWLELIDYCMNDVRLTENLFRLVLANKPLYFQDLKETKEIYLNKPIFKTPFAFQNTGIL